MPFALTGCNVITLQERAGAQTRAGPEHRKVPGIAGLTSSLHRRSTDGEYENSIDLSEPVVKKFNNTLAGTDCGDAGLPAPIHDIAKAKTVLRVVPKTPDNALRAGCDRTRQQDREDVGNDG